VRLFERENCWQIFVSNIEIQHLIFGKFFSTQGFDCTFLSAEKKRGMGSLSQKGKKLKSKKKKPEVERIFLLKKTIAIGFLNYLSMVKIIYFHFLFP